MNRFELRYEIKKALLGKYGPEGVESAELIGPDSGEPGAVIEVVTDDPYDVADPGATRHFRVTVEEIGH